MILRYYGIQIHINLPQMQSNCKFYAIVTGCHCSKSRGKGRNIKCRYFKRFVAAAITGK